MTWRSAGLPAAPLLSVCCWLTAHQSRCATRRSAAHGGCSEDWRHRVCYHVPLAQTGVPRPISARRSCWCARGGCRCSVLLLTLDTCRVVVFLACGFNHTPTGLFLVIPGVLEVGGRCRDGGRGRCARRKVDGEGEEEARASPSRRSANETSNPLRMPQRAFPGEVKPKPPSAGPTREVHQNP